MIMKINKYKVSQELMNDINDWRDRAEGLVVDVDLKVGIVLPWSIHDWWMTGDGNVSNNRLISLIQYVNGEDVFEVDKPKKWVVRSKIKENGESKYNYLRLIGRDYWTAPNIDEAIATKTTVVLDLAFKFDSKEESEKWTNPMMEAVEVEDD